MAKKKAPKPVPQYDLKEGTKTYCGGVILSVCNERGEPVKANAKGFDPAEPLMIRGMANRNMEDRYKEILSPVGCDTRNFLLNPILLADHSYTCRSAVGQVTAIDVQDDGVHFEAWIGNPKLAPLTEAQLVVRSLIAQGILKTVSVGFIPKKIKYPVFNDEGAIIEPAVIEQWELLELSVVAVPCNAESVFEMKGLREEVSRLFVDFAKGLGKATESEPAEVKAPGAADSMVVQTLIFSKDSFKTKEEAAKWAQEHNFRSDKVDETSDSFRLRQRDPNDFDDTSFRTIDLTDGVKAVVGKLKKELQEKEQAQMEELLKQLLEMVTGLIESVNAVKAAVEKLAADEEPTEEKPTEEPPATTEEGCKPDKEKKEAPPAENPEVKAIGEKVAKLEGSIEKLAEAFALFVQNQTKKG